jgi:hypothetical protein
MSKAIYGIAALTAIGAAAAYVLYQQHVNQSSPATANSVTSSAKSGSLITQPWFAKVAVAAIKDPLSWAPKASTRAAAKIPSGLSNGSAATNWRIPFGNPQSQQAASQAVKATNVSNYRPSSWASPAFLNQ